MGREAASSPLLGLPDRASTVGSLPSTGAQTAGSDYQERLELLSGARWKRVLDVQRPYRWNLRRLNLGLVLDVGCGIGRNLAGLAPYAVGVDHNAASVEVCRARGLTAYATEEFEQSQHARVGSFDAMLVSHVLEHIDMDTADAIVRRYLPFLRRAAAVVFITPQERGFPTDPTHVRFVDERGLREHAHRLGLHVERSYSFPFPRAAGRLFAYNEFVQVARTPA